MPEPYRTDVALRPDRLFVAAVIDEAREIVDRLLASTDPDEQADLLEHAVDKTERAHAVIFCLLLRVRGVDLPSSVEVANVEPTGLILPGGAGS